MSKSDCERCILKLCMWLGNADLIKQRLVDELNAMGDGARLSVEFKSG